MQEKTLPRPLSGTEIKTAILKKLEQSMNRDSRLANHVAYGAFSYHFRLDIKFQDLGTQYGQTAEEGQETLQEVENPEVILEVETLDWDEEAKAPNQVRVETEQPVPVAVKEPSGKVVERRVTYKDPKFREKAAKK